MESGRRARSVERKSVLPVPLHQRSSSVGPNTQCVYSTPRVRQSTAQTKSSSRLTSARKFLGNVQLPIADKEFQKHAVTKVRNYFQQNSDINIRWATFGSQPQAVATTVEMFNFLLKMMFKDIELDMKNYADEIPRFMKLLSYPVNIQKSTLVTINTKNTWPSVLSMLVFLVDHVSMINKSEVSEMMFPDGEDFEIQSLLFWHSLWIYRIWHQYSEGEDERKIREANEQLKNKLKQLYTVDQQHLNDIENEIKVLEKELKSTICIKLEETVQMLQAKADGLNNDKEVAQLEINQMQNKQMELERQVGEKKNKLHLLEKSNSRKKEEIQRLEELCSTQEMTVEDKEKILQECTELRQRIKDAEELCSSLKAASFHTDKEMATIKTEVDNPYVELKTFLCEKMHIPEVSGIKIGLRYNLEDWKYVKNELLNLKKQLGMKKLQVVKCFAKLKTSVSTCKEHLDQLLKDEVNGKRCLQDLEDCLQKLKSDINKIDAAIRKKEEEREEKVQILNKIITELEDIATEQEDCKKRYSNEATEREQEIKELQELLQWMKKNLKEIKNDYKEKTGWTDIDL